MSVTAKLRALRALARVELRQLRRNRGRSLLVVLLIAVPVAAIVGGSALVRITEPTADERATHAMGRAALRIDGLQRPEDRAEVRALISADAEVVDVFTGMEQVSVPGRRLRARLFAVSPDAIGPGGLASGMLLIQRGRAPANSGEVALSPVLMGGLDRGIDDTVALEYGPVRTITGVVIDSEDLSLPVVLRTPAAVEHGGRHILLAAVADDDLGAVRRRLGDAGYPAETRADAATADAVLVALVFVLGCVGLFEAALVIAAAFAVSLRRRQYEIGLLGSTGATMKGVTTSLLLSAAALALGGGLLGAALGATGAMAVHPWLDGLNGRLNGGFELSLIQALGAVVLGVVTAVLAATMPARSAARVPIREALGGRRPVTSPSSTWLAVGVTMVAAGLGLLLFAPREHLVTNALGVVGGPVLGLLGFGACSPWLLDWLSRRAARLPLAWRLAVRDAGRFRGRNGAVVTAVLAGMSMSVTVAILVSSLESALDAIPAGYRDDQLLVEGAGAEEAARRLAAELEVVASAPLQAAYVSGDPVRARFGAEPDRLRKEWIAVGDDDLVRTLGIEDELPAFRAGRLLALDPPDDAEPLVLSAWLDGRQLDAPVLARVATSQRVREPRFILSRSAAAALDFDPGPPLNRSLVPWLVRFEGPITADLLERAQEIAAGTTGTSLDANLLHVSPARGFYHAVVVLCALTGLIVVLIATSLSASESAGEERVLQTVGAAPALLRAHLAARAGYLALLGCALAVPAGLLTAVALFEAANLPVQLVMPWLDLGFALLALPVLVYAITWTFGVPQRPRLITE